MEDMGDINDLRFVVFKQYILQVMERMDNPLWIQTFARYRKHFNAGEHFEAAIELENFTKAIQLNKANYDAYDFCFCLIFLEPGEDQLDTTDALQLRKLEELRAQGLTRKFVEESVLNFMKASPATFGGYLVVLKSMSLESLVESLKG
jgi:hypothetical protein